MTEHKHIVSFSGGKDSTAMLLRMLELDMQIDEVIFCDTGKEFPAMYEHIKEVEKYTGLTITRLKYKWTFDYMFGFKEINKRDGSKQTGYWWPDFQNRWCTAAIKRQNTKQYLKGKEYILYEGIAIDESWRIEKNNDGRNHRYPLVEWNWTEQMALDYCYSKGFEWDGLYKLFGRVSCYLCPLSSIDELRTVYNKFPELWADIEYLDTLSERDFRSDYTVEGLKNKFEREKVIKKKLARQQELFSPQDVGANKHDETT